MKRSLARMFSVLGGPRSERAFFDAAYYARVYPDVAAAGVDPFDHFMTHGWREGRRPSAAFDTLYYRDRHLGGAERNPLSHYLAAGGRSSGLAIAAGSADEALSVQRAVVGDLFDVPYYRLQTGPLVEEPIAHYLTDGWRQGRTPSPSFDPTRYVAGHAFVASLDVSPFYHYASQHRMRRGLARREAIAAASVPRDEILRVVGPAFDAAHYLRRYPDVKASGTDPLVHYLDHGRTERRDPTALFDAAYYTATNRDVAAASQEPFYHYLTIGRAEGRRPNPVGGRLYPKPKAPQVGAWGKAAPAADTDSAEVVVIMPVYKGYDETLAAIHAVLTAPQGTRFALHVINDMSPDGKLAAALDALAARGLFSLATNEANLGFVKTVNRGLRAFPDQDVVLLNADTRVFGDWLDRLVAHAGRDARIATITPLSNNATICSYPSNNDNNLIETECTAEALDRLAATCNAGRASDIPTGVGFCFYMSRASRESLGLLDEETFGRGYGEENDFCLRAAKAGFRNLLAEDVFVYHAGEVSFAGLADTAAALAALLGKHPDYMSRVRSHILADPGEWGRMRLDLARLARDAGPAPVVFVSHALRGGVVTHIDRLQARLLEEGVKVVHLRVGVADRWSIEIVSGSPTAPFCPNLRPVSLRQAAPLVAEFLGWLAPRAIHLHSLVGFDWGATTDLLDLVRGWGGPYYFTLHDYSVVCHRNDLVPPSGRFCGLPDVDVCRACVGGDRSYPEAVDPGVRRRTYDDFLRGATAVFAPSEDIRTRLRAAGAGYAITVRPHEEGPAPAPLIRRPEPNGIVDVAAIGAIGLHKGSRIILDLARDARARRLPIRYHIIGYSDVTEELAALGVRESGRYETDAEAVALVEALQPACILLPSLAPETFCFALSLAFDLGIPPVVLDLGAQAARVREAEFGFLLPLSLIDDPGTLNDRLLQLDLVAKPSTTRPRAFYQSIVADYYVWETPAESYVRSSTRHARLISSSVRDVEPEEFVDLLRFTESKGLTARNH